MGWGRAAAAGGPFHFRDTRPRGTQRKGADRNRSGYDREDTVGEGNVGVDQVERRLAAIMAADVAGYSRLMGADEEGTLKTLTLYRGVIAQFVEEHQGRVVDAVGDSILAEFGSAVQAVRAAVAIQRALDRRNADLEEARRMHFRIGINVGDVMVQGSDLLGDGVNIAARLEQLAKPGSIYVS